MVATLRHSSSHHEKSSPVLEGDVLAGKYKVSRVLGVGGMGVVVEGLHLELDKRVAIKFLRADALADSEAVQRFTREARAAVRLKSEHVARVLDVGRLESGSPFMVMELLEGEDLGDMLDRNELPEISSAIDYVLQACEAIAEAHSLGIIHRDLKPRNLFLSRRVDGRPMIKVLDFGISKLVSTDESFSLTRTTDVMGSPSYMSPEQLRSARNVDARTDIWALGVILYELLTGKLPFAAETVTELVLKIVQDTPPSICAACADVPADLEAAVMRALEKNVEKRYANIGELAHALEPFTEVRSTNVAARIESVGRGMRRTFVPVTRTTARVSVSGGTSVSWGETEMNGDTAAIPSDIARSSPNPSELLGPPSTTVARPRPRSRYIITGAALLVVAGVASAGAVLWPATSHTQEPALARPPHVTESVPYFTAPSSRTATRLADGDAGITSEPVIKIRPNIPPERKTSASVAPPASLVPTTPLPLATETPVLSPVGTEKVPTAMPDERK